MPPALALTPAERATRIRAQIAERQARARERRSEQSETWRAALEQIAGAGTIREARAIAADALRSDTHARDQPPRRTNGRC